MFASLGSRSGRGRAGRGLIPAGYPMPFVQTNAPVGWLKSTTHNDKALRIVSGTASSGGTNSFSATFASVNTAAYTLATADIASHAHAFDRPQGTSGSAGMLDSGSATSSGTPNTGNTGGGGSHLHTLDLRVQYVDVIIATKL